MTLEDLHYSLSSLHKYSKGQEKTHSQCKILKKIEYKEMHKKGKKNKDSGEMNPEHSMINIFQFF